MKMEKKHPEEILNELLERYPKLCICKEEIKAAYQALVVMYQGQGCLYVAGNGGSAADSEHIVGELMKSFLFKRDIGAQMRERMQTLYQDDADRLIQSLEGGLAAVSLPSLVSLATAVANDVSGDMVYAQMLQAAAKKGDLFWGISASGNSANIIHAMMVAKAKHVACIGLTGESRCKMDGLADIVIHVPQKETFQIQELHLPVYHAICAMLEARFFEVKQLL